MKHLLLLLILLSISNYTFCQLKPTTETEIQRIDLKLEKFRKQHQTGVFLSFLGAGLALIPMLATGKANPAVIIGGSVLSTAGLITSLNSYKHLRYTQLQTEP